MCSVFLKAWLCFVGMIFIIIYLSWRYRNHKSCDLTGSCKMKWSMIKKLYRVNPYKWDFEKIDCPTNYGKTDFRYLLYSPNSGYRYKGEAIRIDTSIFGFILLYFFYNRSKRLKKKQIENKHLAVVLEDAQRDISQLTAQAQHEIDKARKITEQIGARL